LVINSNPADRQGCRAHTKNTPKNMSKTTKTLNVAVLYGGPSSEHEVSLNTGKNVIKALEKIKHNVIPIKISKEGEWNLKNRVVPAYVALEGADVVFNAMHGEFGEDGTVQGFLEAMNIPYTGSDQKASSAGIDKAFSKYLFSQYDIPTAKYVVAEKNREVPQIPFSYPVVVKPNSRGSSVGVNIVNDKADLSWALNKAFAFDKKAIIEKLIQGRELTVGVIENFEDKKVFAFAPTEIIPSEEREFFDYDAKYSEGATKEVTPADLMPSIAKKAQRIAADVFRAIGARHYSRVDMIIDKNDNIFVLEINTLPGLTSTSLLPQQAKHSGLTLEKLIDHLLQLATTDQDDYGE
jgi:D-alanine--D-alanine ligase